DRRRCRNPSTPRPGRSRRSSGQGCKNARPVTSTAATGRGERRKAADNSRARDRLCNWCVKAAKCFASWTADEHREKDLFEVGFQEETRGAKESSDPRTVSTFRVSRPGWGMIVSCERCSADPGGRTVRHRDELPGWARATGPGRTGHPSGRPGGTGGRPHRPGSFDGQGVPTTRGGGTARQDHGPDVARRGTQCGRTRGRFRTALRPRTAPGGTNAPHHRGREGAHRALARGPREDRPPGPGRGAPFLGDHGTGVQREVPCLLGDG